MKNISFDKYINYLIIALAFCLPITKAGTVFFSHLIILSFLIHISTKRNFGSVLSELKKSHVIIGFGLFLLVSMLSIIWSSDKIFALLYIKKYYHFLTIPIIYLYFNTKYISHVFTSFLLAMLLSEVLSYSIFFEVFNPQNAPPNIFNVTASPQNPSPFMNHSNYSLYLSFAVMILLNRIFFIHNLKHKIIYILFFIASVSNLFINGGRTGQIIFVITLFVILILNIKHKLFSIAFSFVLAITILTTAYNVSPVFHERGTLAYYDIKGALFENNYSGSFGQRLSLWVMGANVFKDNPILGVGIGDERTGMQQYAQKYNFSKYKNLPDEGYIDYHGIYIHHAVQLGILGPIILLYIMYSIFVIKFKSIIYRNLNIAFATSVFIFSIVNNITHSMFPMALFAFFTAVFIAISRTENLN